MMLLLTGCGSWCKKEVEYVDKIIVKEVKIPIFVDPPPPPIIIRPQLAINQLDDQSIAGEVVKAALASIQQLLGYSIELEHIINSYRQDYNIDTVESER